VFQARAPGSGGYLTIRDRGHVSSRAGGIRHTEGPIAGVEPVLVVKVAVDQLCSIFCLVRMSFVLCVLAYVALDESLVSD
jgi:hypothetical protein